MQELQTDLLLICSNVSPAVANMRARGVEFLEIPDHYYDDVEAKYDHDARTMAALRANNILYDREGGGIFPDTPTFSTNGSSSSSWSVATLAAQA